MKKPDTIIIEGRAHSWRVILEMRRAQLPTLIAWIAALLIGALPRSPAHQPA